MEIWKTVVVNGEVYENYMVSNMGNVRRIYKNGKIKNLKGRDNNKGYYTIDLCVHCKKKQVLLHRLVAEAFLDNENKLPCVNHKDECPHNNQVDNLEWCTYKYNNNYGTAKKRMREKVIKGTMGINKINGHVVIFSRLSEASTRMNISISSISNCCNGKIKRRRSAGNYYWCFIN